MNILIDARWTRTDYHDGISRYTAGLVQGFIDNEVPVTVLVHDKRQLDMLPGGIRFEMVNNPLSFAELTLAKRLNALKPDVVFSPLQVMGFFGRRYKLVLTLQDIIYYQYPTPPKGLPVYVRVAWRLFHLARWPQRFLLNRADHVTTVSRTSKKYIEAYGLTDRPISVIYNAPSLGVIEGAATTPVSKSIVYMGSFMPYKNVETLIQGMASLPGYTLHLLSKISAERRRELDAVVPVGAHVVFHDGVSDETYRELVTQAACLATASKAEGFGLPITEAQLLGTPVVCSNMDIFHEVAGEGALYFDADQPSQFAAQVLSLEDNVTRQRMTNIGRAQAQTFTWQRSAAALYDVFEKITR